MLPSRHRNGALNLRLAIVWGGLLSGAWPSLAHADDDGAPAADDVDAADTLEVRGLVMPRLHVVDERGGAPSDTDRQLVFLRRARAQLAFEPDRHLRLVVEGELMDPSAPVRDAYARYRVDRKLEVTAGYFKRPFGATELDGVWDLLVSERGLGSRMLRGRTQAAAEGADERPLTSRVAGRDVGVMLAGRWTKLAGLGWSAGGWNGHGEGGLGARLTVSPGPVTLGVSAGWNRAPDEGMRNGAALGVDVTLDSRWVFARVEGFVGALMPVTHDAAEEVIWAQWAGGLLVAAARIPIPGACIVLLPGGKVELLDQTTDGRADELILISPLLRADLGEHFRILLEGNFLVAGDNAETPGAELVIESFVLQLGARV